MPLGGGSISRVERLETTAGPFVVKSMAAAPDGMFEAEAAGLEAIRAAASGFVVPRVIAAVTNCPVDSGDPLPFLVIEFLAPGPASTAQHETVGRCLAALHRTSSARFGFLRDTFCGATRQVNTWTPAWVPFYTTQRLGTQVDLARRAGRLDTADLRILARLLSRLDTWLLEPVEGPALIHGDLWNGNLHTTPHGPALLDPSVSFSHREAELGMMTLFGGFHRRVFDAYDEAFPLEHGWRDRQPLYELYHLLNHLNLFGAGYHRAVMDVARRFV